MANEIILPIITLIIGGGGSIWVKTWLDAKKAHSEVDLNKITTIKSTLALWQTIADDALKQLGEFQKEVAELRAELHQANVNYSSVMKELHSVRLENAGLKNQLQTINNKL